MRPAVKICGITNFDDAALALELGADFLGFIFAPSPRNISPAAARLIVDRLKESGFPGKAGTVAVFVNESPQRMAAILAETGIGMAQIHGDERPGDCAGFCFPWYRALRVFSEGDVGTYACPRLLFDTVVPGLYGGSGTTMDSGSARAAIALARAAGKEAFIAGGINPGNVAEIVRSLSPDGIDVGSGVEERPGKKSAEKLVALFRELALAGDRVPAPANGAESARNKDGTHD